MLTTNELLAELRKTVAASAATGPVFVDDEFGVMEVMSRRYPDDIVTASELAEWLLAQYEVRDKMWVWAIDPEHQLVRIAVAASGKSINRAFKTEIAQTFVDISSEVSRTYNFGARGFVKIDQPLKLAVSDSGGHRIYSRDGRSHYIPTGWLQLSWTVREGEPNFVA